MIDKHGQQSLALVKVRVVFSGVGSTAGVFSAYLLPPTRHLQMRLLPMPMSQPSLGQMTLKGGRISPATTLKAEPPGLSEPTELSLKPDFQLGPPELSKSDWLEGDFAEDQPQSFYPSATMTSSAPP